MLNLDKLKKSINQSIKQKPNNGLIPFYALLDIIALQRDIVVLEARNEELIKKYKLSRYRVSKPSRKLIMKYKTKFCSHMIRTNGQT